jgi:hypothetical protein
MESFGLFNDLGGERFFYCYDRFLITDNSFLMKKTLLSWVFL